MTTYKSYDGNFANNDHVTGIFRGLIRSTTASVIRGKNNEQRLFDRSPYGRMSKEDYQKLKNDIQINGIKEPVFIVLEWNNRRDELKLEKAMADKGYFDPYSYPMDVVVETCIELFNGIPVSFSVYEGNHRIRIAEELGIDVPAEIRFFGNSNLLIPYDHRTSRLLKRLLKNDPIYSEITEENQMKRSNPKRRRNGSPESRFLEDLRAITVEHSLQQFQGLSSRGETFALQDDDCFVVFNLVGMKDLRMRPMTSDEADTANENEDTNIYHKGLVPTMNGFYLDRIDIRPRRKSCYGRKLGWKAMKMLTQLADKHKISLALHYEIDSSDNPHGVQDLEGFYSRFGFKESWVGSDMDWYMMIYPNTYYELHHKSTNPKRRRNRKQSQSVNSDNGKNMINRKRNNPSKCNDKSFSASTSKGACTWHQGVEKKVSQSEYDKSQSRVRYRSPKGYKGAFAPRKGKSVSKPKPQLPAIENTFDQGLKVFEDNQFIIKFSDDLFIKGVFDNEEQFLKALSGFLYTNYLKKFDPNHYPLAYDTIQSEYNNLIKGFPKIKPNTKNYARAERFLEQLKKNLSTAKIGQYFQEFDRNKKELETVYALGWYWQSKMKVWLIQYSNDMVLEHFLSDDNISQRNRVAQEQEHSWQLTAQSAKVAEQMEKEQKSKDNDLGGYEQGLTPMQLGKLVKTLTKKYKKNGKTVTLKEIIIDRLKKDNAIVKSEKGSWSSYKKIKGEQIEYKHPYSIIMEWGDGTTIDDSNKGYPKSAMKWALWLYENHYKPKTVSIPKPKPVEQTKVEPTFEQYTLAQMKSLVRDSVNRAVLGKKYPRGTKSAMLNAYYASGFDDDSYPPSKADAQDTRNWIAEGFFYEQEEQKVDKAFMDNWVQSFVSKIPAELEKEQLELLEDDKKGLKSKAIYGDFGSFLVSPYFNSDVIHSVRKYMEKDNTGVILPPSIKSIKECSFDYFEKIQEFTGKDTRLDFVSSVVSFDLGTDYIFDLYCRLDGTNKDNLVWEITFNLRQTQIDKGRKGFTDAFECYTVTVEPKQFDKAIAFLKYVAIVIYNLLMLLDTKRDSDWYDFASKLFAPKFVGNHGLFNFVNNLLLDADKLLVKAPKEDKGTIYRVKGTKWVIQKENKALSIYDRANNMFFSGVQTYDATLSKFSCMYLLNVTNAFFIDNNLYVDVRGVNHAFDVPSNLKNFDYKAQYTKPNYSVKSSVKRAVSTKLTIFMSKLLSKDFSLMISNIKGQETGMGTVFRDPPLKWDKTQVVIAVDRNKYWSVVPAEAFRMYVSDYLILGGYYEEDLENFEEKPHYNEVIDHSDLSDFLNVALTSSIREGVDNVHRAPKKDKRRNYSDIDTMVLVSSAVGLSIGSSDFLLSKSKKALELATEYIKMLPEDTQRVFINRRKMIEKSSELMVGINQYNSERVKGNWVVQLRQALKKI